MVRINKFLVLCGLGSRRKVERYITEGRVTVNGKTITDLGRVVDIEADEVRVDYRPMRPVDTYIYLMLNKPKGFITAAEDVEGRSIVMELIPSKYRKPGLAPVGRLDRDTEGLLLLTNDGELAYKLTHPKFEVPKEYLVEIDRPLEDEDKQKMENGIFLYGRKTNPAFVTRLGKSGKSIKIIIREGKKRQVRLTFQNLGYRVKKLKRTGFGPVRLSGINSGYCRLLKIKEISALQRAVKSSM